MFAHLYWHPHTANPMSHPENDPTQTALTDALMGSVKAVLLPLARLAVGKGLPHAVVEEALRHAFVQAATQAIQEAQPDALAHRMVSRISTITGINRREVTRLTQSSTPLPAKRPSVASEVFTRWLSDRRYRHRNGRLKALPRQGEAPSFESLAQSVTRDVHPRSILDELCRLSLVRLDEAQDTVQIAREAFVPKDDTARMLDFVNANVGDHLQAAVVNVLTEGETPHFEQALWADGLSAPSIAKVKALTRSQWQQMLQLLTPALEELVAADQALPADEARQRLRIGLYSFSDTLSADQH